MPNCYMCKKETPVTRFYLLRIISAGEQNVEGQTGYYACGIKCLKVLVLDKVYGGIKYLLREYMDTCDKSWEFGNGDELRKFVAQMGG